MSKPKPKHEVQPVEFGMRFALWAKDRRVTWRMIADHFDCSRATAYRMLRRWHDVRGVFTPERGG